MTAFRPAHRNAARISWIDRKAGVVWIDADGVAAETVYGLKHYGVCAIASEYSGRIGIPFRPGTKDDILDIFTESARFVVGCVAAESHAVNTATLGLARHLVILQGLQASMRPATTQSDEERLMSEWLNGKGGAA